MEAKSWEGEERSRWGGPGEHFIFLIDNNGFINEQSSHTPHTLHHGAGILMEGPEGERQRRRETETEKDRDGERQRQIEQLWKLGGRTPCLSSCSGVRPCLGASSPVRVFLQHLVDADAKCLIVEALMDEVFVDPELGSGDSLAFGDPRQIEAELFVMPPHRQELLVVLHYREKRQKMVLSGFFRITLSSLGASPSATDLPAFFCKSRIERLQERRSLIPVDLLHSLFRGTALLASI